MKQRLARDIDDRSALRFYTATLMRLLRALARDRRFRAVVALTPDRASFACRLVPRASPMNAATLESACTVPVGGSGAGR